MVALVGSTGSGKSTLIKILLRFYNVKSGDVTVGGKNIYDFSIEEMRKYISYVSQDTTLFPGTIADNIAFSQDKIDQERMIRSSKNSSSNMIL